jgi:tetratricopeptide (TPR) repeat protein
MDGISASAEFHGELGLVAPGSRRLRPGDVLRQGRARHRQGIANPRVDACAHTIVAKVHLRRGDHREAERYYELGLHFARTNRIAYLEVDAQLGLAATHHAAARPDTALDLCTQALHTAEMSGFQIHEATARTLLAELSACST